MDLKESSVRRPLDDSGATGFIHKMAIVTNYCYARCEDSEEK